MATDNEFLIHIQDYVRQALCNAADAEIEKLRNRFEREMSKMKREMVGRIINNIDIAATHNPEDCSYTIHVTIKK